MRESLSRFKFLPHKFANTRCVFVRLFPQLKRDAYRLLHNLLNFLAEITSRYLNSGLVIYAALCNPG